MLIAHIEELSDKHRSLERKIQEEISRPCSDSLKIAAMKKQKLQLKDRITNLEKKVPH